MCGVDYREEYMLFPPEVLYGKGGRTQRKERRMKTKFFIGTAGWSYKDWVPMFYPYPQSRDFDWLQFYASYFNCVEVNSTYYKYLNDSIIKGWARKVAGNDDFVFTVKMHHDFTHKREYDEEQIKAMRTTLDILKDEGRLGGVLIQFPYSFPYNSNTMNYVRMLNEDFHEYTRFLEVRHATWDSSTAQAFCKEHNLTMCTIDQPQIGRSLPFHLTVLNDKAYIRMHGRNTAAWKQSITNYGKEQSYAQQSERYKYLYSPGELMEISQVIKEVQTSVREVYVIMNNHPVGNAPANALEMIHMLEKKIKVKMPETMTETFERLKRFAQPVTEINDLFS